MQKIFSCRQAAELEKLAKENFAIPPFLMMENAAKAMADFVEEKSVAGQDEVCKSVLIVCGKGNNGGDGYALARLLQDKFDVTVAALEPPTADEAKAQYEMCKRLGVKIEEISKDTNTAESADVGRLEKISKALASGDFVIDCIYGSGFHGELSPNIKKIIDIMNASRAIKIACDIPSALEFAADYTITMGCQKLALYSDKAKAVCGEIIVADLGISRHKFENPNHSKPEDSSHCQTENQNSRHCQSEMRDSSHCQSEGQDSRHCESEGRSNLYLIQPGDRELPLRKDRAAHKGKYGHTAVMCGDKAGAAILSATAAMNFGSGLTSLIKTQESNLNQFRISPSLMIADSIPKKTTCIAMGSGFTEFPKQAASTLLEWFKSSKSPAAVLDAGVLTSPEFPPFLKELNECEGTRIVLTPHLSELSKLLEVCISWSRAGAISSAASSASATGNSQQFSEISSLSANLPPEICSITALANSPEVKITAGNFLTSLFPRTTVIMKSANTFIASGGETFIIADGAQSLAKGGSGDILAGLTAALLAQGYTARSAAITAAEHHALLSQELGPQAYNLTPEKLLEELYKSF